MDGQPVFLRILVVLTASTVGLGIGSLIYYSFIEDSIIFRTAAKAANRGRFYFALSFITFLLTIWLLYLHNIPPIIVACVGMATTKLGWNLGDGFTYANTIFEALTSLEGDSEKAREFIKSASTYRQIQDIRSMANTFYAPNSQQMAALERIICAALDKADQE